MVNLRLNDHQQQLVEQNLPLVHFIIHRYFPHVSFTDYEDYVQIGSIGLCRAVACYDPGKSQLSTYACNCIRSILRDYERNARAACRDIRKEVCSVDDPDFGGSVTSIDTVESLAMANEITRTIRDLPQEDMQIIILHMMGYSQRKIALHMNLSQGWVSKRLGVIRRRLRREVGV